MTDHNPIGSCCREPNYLGIVDHAYDEDPVEALRLMLLRIAHVVVAHGKRLLLRG